MSRSANQAKPKDYFRGDIEGLRGISIALVVLFHAKISGFNGGFVGVDVFYVLSGYLITGLLLREKHASGAISLRQFYARRIRRLLPAAVLVLAVTLIASWYILPQVMIAGVATDAAAAALYLSNMNFAKHATDYFATTTIPSPFLHYWSLSVEEQYYLFWPALVLLLTRRSKNPKRVIQIAVSLIGAGSFLFALWLLQRNATWAFFSLPSRAWELALGGAIAVSGTLIARIPSRAGSLLSIAGVAAVVGSGLFLKESAPFPGWPALLPTVGTALVIIGGTASMHSWANRLLAFPPLRFLGRISYSLYLWHWPVLILPIALASAPLTLAQRAGLMVLGLVLASITHIAIEKPLRKGVILGLQPRWNFSFAAGTAALMVVAAFVTNTTLTSEAATPTSTLTNAQKAAALDAILGNPDPIPEGNLPRQDGLSPAPLPSATTESLTPSPVRSTQSPLPSTPSSVKSTPALSPIPSPSKIAQRTTAKPTAIKQSAPATRDVVTPTPSFSASPASSQPSNANPSPSPATSNAPSNSSSPTDSSASPAQPTDTSSASTSNSPPTNTLSPSASAANPPAFTRLQTVDSLVPKNLDPSLLAAKTDRALSYKDGCHTQQNLPASTKPCVYGNPKGKKLVVLFGDSHALAWFPAINAVAKAKGWKLLSLTMSACSPASIPAYDPATKAAMNNCPIWRKASIARIVAAHPYLVLVAGTRGFITLDSRGAIATGDSRMAIFDAGMKTTINALKKTAAHVILIQDIPAAGTDPVICLSIHTHTLPCATPVDRAISSTWQSEEVKLASDLSIGIIDPSYWVCPTSPCPVVLGNLMIYADTGHLTATFSGALATRMSAAISRNLVD